MPLMIGGGGDSKPYIRFGSNENTWKMSSPEGPVEFDFDSPVVFDLHNLVVGWLKIDAMGRDWQPWPSNTQRTQQPSEDYKQGFAVNVVSKKLFGDEPVREFSANTFGSLQFIKELYDSVENTDEFKQGMCPVVQITGSRVQKVGKGNPRVPEFEVKKWVPRPSELGEAEVQSPPTSATSAPAPVAQAPAPVEDDEF